MSKDAAQDARNPFAGFSPQQLEKMSQQAQKLATKNPRCSKAYFSMVAAVRLYNTALAAIHDETLAAGLGETSEAISQILIHSVRGITSKEFTRSELAQHLQQHALEFIAMELSLEKEVETKQARDASAAETSRLKKMSVPLGYHHTSANAPAVLARDRTALLVGPHELLGELLRSAVEAVKLQGQAAIYLLRGMKASVINRDANRNLQVVELGSNHWVNFADSRRRMSETMTKLLHRIRGNRADLLIVGDLGQAHNAAGTLPVEVRANSAHKTIRRFADEAGCGVLACLNIQDADPGDKRWNQLEVYTDLRFVSLDAENIIIAERGGDSWSAFTETIEVPKDEPNA
jgi:hypothetical protein